MAADTVLLSRKRLLTLALESTSGSGATLNAAAGALNAFNVQIKADIPAVQRKGQGSLTNLFPVAGARKGTLDFDTEIYNAASAPLWLTALQACGCAVSSSTYAPATGTYNTAALGVYMDGSRLLQLFGAVGNCVLSFKRGEPAMAKFHFEGVWQPPSTVSMVSPTFPTTVPPRAAACTLSVGGTSTYRVGQLDFDLGNKIAMREDLTDVSGFRAAICTDRDPRVKIPLEALALGTKDWFADMLASTSSAFSLAIGSGANGIITIAASNMYQVDPPNYEDRDGVQLDSLNFMPASTTADGEFTIVRS